jgi:hypothetical protein
VQGIYQDLQDRLLRLLVGLPSDGALITVGFVWQIWRGNLVTQLVDGCCWFTLAMICYG